MKQSLLAAFIVLSYFRYMVKGVPVSLQSTDSRRIASLGNIGAATRNLSDTSESSRSLTTTRKKSDGVWPITKLAILLGPTLAIHMYHLLCDLYEKHEPIVIAKLNELVSDTRTRIPILTKLNESGVLISSHGIPVNGYESRVGEEVIRQANERLREQAIVSRIQMDDDQYEFDKEISKEHVGEITKNVLEQVLSRGAGKYLNAKEKQTVRRLIDQVIE